MQFTRGQKSKLSALTPGQQIEVGVRLAGGGHDADTVLCLVLGADQKVADAQSVLGAHQPTGAGGFIVWQGAKDGDTGVFWIDLAQLPAGHRLAIVVGGTAPYSALGSGQVRISAVGGGEVMTYPITGGDFSDERALILTELYVKDEWRVAAMGHGFNGGLDALLASYGAAPIPGAAPAAPPPAAPPPAAPPPAAPPPAAPPPAAPPPAAPPPAAPPPAAPPPAAPPPAAPPPAAPPPAAPPPAAPPPAAPPPAAPPPAAPPPAAPPPAAAAPPPAAAPPAAGGVNLGKVTLTKQGESRSVSLAKTAGVDFRPIHVNLNWQESGGKRRGFLSGRSSAPDLDLGCMFELQDGQSSVIQPLGGNLGWPDSYPWLYLDKDDRSGRATDGENLYIVKPEVVKRVMVFALIYEGAADFRSVGAYLTVVDHLGAITQVALDNPDANRTFCAVATITVQGDQLVIQKEERYFRGHRDADGFYGFGFDWTPGRKD